MNVQFSQNHLLFKMALDTSEVETNFASFMARSLEGNDAVSFEYTEKGVDVYFKVHAFGIAVRYVDMVVADSDSDNTLLSSITNKLFALHQKHIGDRHLKLVYCDGKEVNHGGNMRCM